MVGANGLSSFARFFLIVNPEFLALVRFLGVALGFALVFFVVVLCCAFALFELKEIFRLCKKIKRRIESYL